MSEAVMEKPTELLETAAEDAQFQALISQMEEIITPGEEEELILRPVMKEAGTSDQGFRYD